MLLHTTPTPHADGPHPQDTPHAPHPTRPNATPPNPAPPNPTHLNHGPRARVVRLYEGAPADLRRRSAREHGAHILALADLLPTSDRLLLSQVLEEGRSVASLALLIGQKPATLRRRVKALIARVRSPRFAIVRAHAHEWPQTRARVAHACVIEGRSMPEAARALGLTYHVVRTQMREITLLVTTLEGTQGKAGALTSQAQPSQRDVGGGA